MTRKKLGEMLIEAGVLDEMSLRSALADQRRWGRSLGRTLVEMKLVDEPVIVEVLARQLNLESVDLDALLVAPDVLKLVPAELARQAHVVPFRVVMKFLDIAMGDPTNQGLIDELRIRTQLNIRPFLCGPRQIERNIARYYGDGLKPDISIPFESPDLIEATVPTGPRSAGSTRPPPLADLREMPSGHPAHDMRPLPRTMPPPMANAPAEEQRDAEINALQVRLSKLEALVARDEQVLRKLLALLIEKGVATREEIVERLA